MVAWRKARVRLQHCHVAHALGVYTSHSEAHAGCPAADHAADIPLGRVDIPVKEILREAARPSGMRLASAARVALRMRQAAQRARDRLSASATPARCQHCLPPHARRRQPQVRVHGPYLASCCLVGAFAS